MLLLLLLLLLLPTMAASTYLLHGLVVDGTGAAAFPGHVVVSGREIKAVARADSPAGRRILEEAQQAGANGKTVDCRGCVVAPGWVDVHTHLDGQITWDPWITPLSNGGVTTAVQGNCGVGFAPCKPQDRKFLMELMEGVEDIPLGALDQGIKWEWETFEEYLDALERKSFAMDVGAMIGHGPVRAYVLGKRANVSDKPRSPNSPNSSTTSGDITSAEIDQMAAIVGKAIKAGAMGFSTSRTLMHRDRSGTLVPGTLATTAELLAIGRAIGENGNGHAVFEMASDFMTGDDEKHTPENHAKRLRHFAAEWTWMKRMSKAFDVPLCFCLGIPSAAPDLAFGYRAMLRQVERANADGCRLKVQVFTRPQGILVAWDARSHPFTECASFDALWRDPAVRNPATGAFDKSRLLRDPDLRDRIVAEAIALATASSDTGNFGMTMPQSTDNDGPGNLNASITSKGALAKMYLDNANKIFRWTKTYDPPATASAAYEAKARGVSPLRVVYEWMCEEQGTRVLSYLFMNYAHDSLDDCAEMLMHPDTIPGLGDTGAHLGFLSDPTSPSFLLTHWFRDTKRFPLEVAVKRHTKDTADAFGLSDRGALVPGRLADINVIDLAKLDIKCPRFVRDLPLGAARWVQDVDGYVLTIKSGVVTYENGKPTGALPGKLLRGAQARENVRKPVPVDASLLSKVAFKLAEAKWKVEQTVLDTLVGVVGPQKLDEFGQWVNRSWPLSSAPSVAAGGAGVVAVPTKAKL